MWSLLLLASAAAQPAPAVLPACAGPDLELAVRATIVICYSSAARTAIWTAYELKAEHLNASNPRRMRFRTDAALKGSVAFDSDYRNSGYVRGHLVPAADVAWSEDALRASYLLSNAVPQDPSLNAGKWRQLENTVRRMAREYDSLLILTGPIFCPRSARIGQRRVAVPCELFKLVFATREGKRTAYAMILPNGPNPRRPLADFEVAFVKLWRPSALPTRPFPVCSKLAEPEANPEPSLPYVEASRIAWE